MASGHAVDDAGLGICSALLSNGGGVLSVAVPIVAGRLASWFPPVDRRGDQRSLAMPQRRSPPTETP